MLCRPPTVKRCVWRCQGCFQPCSLRVRRAGVVCRARGLGFETRECVVCRNVVEAVSVETLVCKPGVAGSVCPASLEMECQSDILHRP